uniref:MORN repeat containing 1 n=1 Tax=Sphenodon punctatus TaxID=8508 RepID=A0A8D0HAP2_SPHPU
WKQGKKHGHGKLSFKDGSYYEGEFVDGEIVGNGLRYWASTGNTYSGQFLLGELHGHGVLQYEDGRKYEGEFSYGKREGHGLLVDKEGQIYEGSFHKNKKHGGGKMIFKNGDKNDMFNGQGSIIHCSGVIYDGLWINGYPAAQAKKLVILGPEVIDVIQGSAITLHVQLQNEEGEVSERKNIFNMQTNGFECISYPLMEAASGSRELPAALPIAGKSGFALADSPIPKGDSEPESGSDTLHGAGDAPSNQDGNLHPPANQRVECGCVVFRDIVLAPPPSNHQPFVPMDELHRVNRPTCQLIPEGNRKRGWGCVAQCAAAQPREYVIMVHEVTSPPFLGHSLPPAFKLLRVLREGRLFWWEGIFSIQTRFPQREF